MPTSQPFETVCNHSIQQTGNRAAGRINVTNQQTKLWRLLGYPSGSPNSLSEGKERKDWRKKSGDRNRAMLHRWRGDLVSALTWPLTLEKTRL